MLSHRESICRSTCVHFSLETVMTRLEKILLMIIGVYLCMGSARAQALASCSAAPANINFGNLLVGTTNAQTVTVTNDGIGPVAVLQATATGAGFSISGPSLPLILAAGQSMNFSATFAPAATGSLTGTISISSSATNSPATVSLSGTGITRLLSVTPSSLDFGNVVLGRANTLPVVLTNTGTDSVTISQVSVAGKEFSIGGLSASVPLAPGQNMSFTATFSPVTSATINGYVTIVSNATNSPINESLSGTGIHTVDLSWVASISKVIGYNVYRGAASGGPYTKLNSSLVTGTTYTDTSVQASQTYFCVATAVDSNNNESVFSTEVSGVVPST
jgi:hypothetical protein